MINVNNLASLKKRIEVLKHKQLEKYFTDKSSKEIKKESLIMNK